MYLETETETISFDEGYRYLGAMLMVRSFEQHHDYSFHRHSAMFYSFKPAHHTQKLNTQLFDIWLIDLQNNAN